MGVQVSGIRWVAAKNIESVSGGYVLGASWLCELRLPTRLDLPGKVDCQMTKVQRMAILYLSGLRVNSSQGAACERVKLVLFLI